MNSISNPVVIHNLESRFLEGRQRPKVEHIPSLFTICPFVVVDRAEIIEWDTLKQSNRDFLNRIAQLN
jgi:hypothetical protein